MKKGGFTLIELLAVIVILAIILAIAIPSITNIIENSQVNAFKSDERMLLKAAKTYVGTNDSALPVNIGDTREVTLSTLQTNGYINTITAPDDKTTNCNGYVLITKTDTTTYNYEPHLNCQNNIGSLAADNLKLYYPFNDFQEPTENKINPNGFSGNSYFSVEKLDEYTFKVTLVSMPATNGYYVGQSYTSLANQPTTISAEVIESTNPNWLLGISGWGTITGSGGYKDGNRYVRTITHNVDWPYSISYAYVSDSFRASVNVGDYIIVRNAQLELKDHVTPFVNGSRTGTIIDYSGNGNNAPLVLASTPKWVNGDRAAYYFDGSSDYIETNGVIPSSSPFTISIWYKPTRVNASYDILYSGTDNIDLQFFFHTTSKSLYTSIENVEKDALLTLSAGTINKWYHLVWTYDNTRRKVYVNGDLMVDNADTTAFTKNDTKVRIGMLPGGTYPLQGYIDDFRVYTRALSVDEVTQLYNSEK